MIKAFEIVNYIGETLRLQLDDPDASGFIVKKVTGLGPVKADVNFTEMASSDGGVDNSARLGTRNIVFTLQFLQSPTIEETRHTSYRFFPIKHKVSIIVETDTRICRTEGTVETNEPNIFSEEEGCTISIVCGNSYFYSVNDQIAYFNGVTPLFEFPFENNSLTEKLIEFGEIQNFSERTIIYEGDGNPALLIQIHLIGKIKGLTFYNVDTRESISIKDDKLNEIIDSEVMAGDDIIINTNQGEKSITLIRAGVKYNILNAVDRPIHWFTLKKGENTFAYGCEEGVSNVQLKIQNKILYEGV